jgi:hypothetical protein
MSNIKVKITNNNISINRNNLTKIIQGNNGFNGINISNGNPGFMSGNTGIIITNNHIHCKDNFYSNGIIIDNRIINDLNITGNNIGGFFQNGIKITAIGGNFGIISNNNIYRQDGKLIDSFICGGGVATYAVVTDNFFSHDTVDDANNWQDIVKNRGAYWTVERNKNQVEEIEVNAASGNYFATNTNVNISSNDLLQITSVTPVVQDASTPIPPANGTVENDVRISLLKKNASDQYPQLLQIFNYSILDTNGVSFDGTAAPLYIPTFTDIPTPTIDPIYSAIDNAFGLVHSESGGLIYVDAIGTTMSVPFRIHSEEDVNEFDQDFGFPFVRSFNWLEQGQSTVSGYLNHYLKGILAVPDVATLYVKITGSNKGFNGTFPVLDIVGNSLKLDFDGNIDSAPTPTPPEPDPSNVAWAVNLFDLIGNHRILQEGSLSLSATSGTIGDISVILNKQTQIAAASNINSDTTINFTGIPSNYVNTSGANIKAIINNLSGNTRLKMTLRYKW